MCHWAVVYGYRVTVRARRKGRGWHNGCYYSYCSWDYALTLLSFIQPICPSLPLENQYELKCFYNYDIQVYRIDWPMVIWLLVLSCRNWIFESAEAKVIVLETLIWARSFRLSKTPWYKSTKGLLTLFPFYKQSYVLYLIRDNYGMDKCIASLWSTL